jgi:hypothetical protein
MQKKKCFTFDTPIGPFHIVKHGGMFHPVFQGHDLGAYLTAQHAADDLARGKAFTVPGVKDVTKLGIPSELSHWQICPD